MIKKQNGQDIEIENRRGIIGFDSDTEDGFIEEGSDIWLRAMEDEEFAKITDESLAEGKLLVNDMAESQLMSAIRDRNMTAIIFWLKHHHSSYGTRVEITAKIQDKQELTSEQKALVEEALRLAALPSPDQINQIKQEHE